MMEKNGWLGLLAYLFFGLGAFIQGISPWSIFSIIAMIPGVMIVAKLAALADMHELSK